MSQAEGMRIAVITGDGAEHRYVTNALVARYPVSAIFVCDPPARRSWKSILRRDPLSFFDKAARSVFLRLIGDEKKRKAALDQVLGASGRAFAEPKLVERVGRPKDGRLVKAVEKLSPDILAIYGTGMIPDSVLKMARVVALNMHTGISPYYRGVSCATWPILDGTPEMVGATIHACTAQVDGGEIYFRGRASLSGNETLHGIFAKAVIVGAEGYIRVIGQALKGQLAGEVQDLSVGREYRGSMLGLVSEIRTRRALWQLRRSDRLRTTGGEVETKRGAGATSGASPVNFG